MSRETKVEKAKKRICNINRLSNHVQSGVVYVGHLPHGFYETELKGYFSQFGTVNKVKVARNKKVNIVHCLWVVVYLIQL